MMVMHDACMQNKLNTSEHILRAYVCFQSLWYNTYWQNTYMKTPALYLSLHTIDLVHFQKKKKNKGAFMMVMLAVTSVLVITNQCVYMFRKLTITYDLMKYMHTSG